jgi:predicted phage tail protein
MKRQIAFAGPLADHYTHDAFTLDVDDLVGLLSALEANFHDFKRTLRQYRDVAIYKITGRERADPLTEEEFALSFGSADTILIGCEETGSGPVVMAAVTDWIASYGVSAAIAGAIAYVAVNIAIAYAISAVMKALSSSPSTSSTTKDQNASYLFNGAQNPTEQGGAIPLIYGRFTVGGTIISADISADQVAFAADDTFTVTAGTSFADNVTTNDILRQYLTVTSWTFNGTTYGASASISVPESYAGAADNYIVALSSNGAVTVTSGVNANVNLQGTYTAHDASSNTDVTANVAIAITAPPSYNLGGA